ncbi:MFS transporter [Desulfopila aestuarii]|uniref:Predicted arabinose efflux permease, MFS family n=1 Tax=Desulfopila aestuarii DSM 18488 TaxID=1121416 RepID=A0A1M7Y8K4_9BACT|nr:MFS transporter [Desulfopila aestuarii]SHO48939.1 Predicted arabinose efflux permease, MFS family [Desulfopila aestuarii DSM 18488]
MRLSLHTNIYYLYLIKLSKWFMLIMPVVALFYNANGLDEFDIYLLQAIYSLGVACMEIPSGYMADMIGRRTSLILGSVLGTLGFVLYSVSSSFGHFLIAEIILGLGGSFISGSDSALLYDSLAETGDQNRYLQYEGRITALGNLAETTAAICGGLIAAMISYRAVYGAQALIAAIAIPASLLLVEPQREKLATQPSFSQIIRICHQSLFINLKLSAAILLSSVIGTSTLCMAWTCQVYFVHKGLDETAITPIWVILNLIVAIVSAYSHKLISTIGNSMAILLIILLIPAGYILLGATSLIPGLITLSAFYFIRGYATPLLKDLTNMYCDSTIRATVLSIRSLLIRLGFAALGPMIGIGSRHASLSLSLICTGSVLLILAIIAAIFLRYQAPEIFATQQDIYKKT